VAAERAAPLVVSAGDHPGVVRAVRDLSADINRVTGVTPDVVLDQPPGQRDIVLIGTIGRSPLIDNLIASGKLDVHGIAGNWETSLEQVVTDPMPGVRSAFVIAGSDQRGTIYGIYDVSKGIGVSPWYWWDDVPRCTGTDPRVAGPAQPGHAGGAVPRVLHQRREPGPRHLGTRVLRPRPRTWFPRRFNHQFHAKIFETMLR